MFLSVNGIRVPVEEGTASMATTSRTPERTFGGRAVQAGFGYGRVWKFTTAFLTMDEARLFRVLFTGYFPGSDAIEKTGSWTQRGAPEAEGSGELPPILVCEGEMLGETVKCEGRVVDTEWPSRTIAVMQLELHEVGFTTGGFNTTPDADVEGGPPPITPPGGGGESPYGQLPFVEPPRLARSYIQFEHFEGIFDSDNGPYYDAQGNLLYAEGVDAPSEGVYEEYDVGVYVPLEDRPVERYDAALGKWVLTNDDGTVKRPSLQIKKRFQGPGTLSYTVDVDTDFDGRLHMYANHAEDEPIVTRLKTGLRNVAFAQGRRVVMALPETAIYNAWWFWDGNTSEEPTDSTNTFKLYDIVWQPASTDIDTDTTVYTEDPEGDLTDWGNTVPQGRAHLGYGYFGGEVGDSITDTVTGITYVSSAPFPPLPENLNLFYCPELQPGQVSLIRKRVTGPGHTFVDTSITVDGSGLHDVIVRIANVNTNFTFSRATQGPLDGRFQRRMDIPSGKMELQFIVKRNMTPGQSFGYGGAWIGKPSFASEAGHGPKLHNDVPVPDLSAPPEGATVVRDGYFASQEYTSFGYAPMNSAADVGRGNQGFVSPPLSANGVSILMKRFVGPGTLVYAMNVPVGSPGAFAYISVNGAEIAAVYEPPSAGWLEGSYVVADAGMFEVFFVAGAGPEEGTFLGFAVFEDLVFTPG